MPVHASQYLVPEGIGLDAAVAQLAARLDVASGPAEPVERTFYDTFDGRLHAAGLVLIGAGGRLVAAAGPSYAEVAAALGRPADRIFAGDLAGDRLWEVVAPIVDVRALVPIARVRGRARWLRVLNADAKTVVRLVVETAAVVVGGGAPEVGLRTRLLMTGVRGYDRALARVGRVVGERMGWEASELRLHDEAVRARGGTPGGVSSKLDLRLTGAEPAAVGTAIALGSMLATIEATLPGTVGDVDSEFLHDLRVAVRRTRSVARQLAAVFPADRLGRFREEFRWLGQVTGPTRDLDVLLMDFDRMRAMLPPGRAAELEPLGGLLRARRAEEFDRMAGELRSGRTRAVLDDWGAFLEELRRGGGAGVGGRGGGAGSDGRGGSDDGRAGEPLHALVGGRIRRIYGRMRRAGQAIDEMTPAEALHDLRKQGKELRYLLEIFAGLFPAEAVRPTVKTLKALQETLGEFQDREVQATMLRSLGGELAVADGGPAALLALGVVFERIHAESRAARADFAERFAGFTTPAERAVVKESFR